MQRVNAGVYGATGVSETGFAACAANTMAIFSCIMAIPMIKATYTLDPESVRTLEAMARRLGVSKSEALRRAIHLADRSGRPGRDAPDKADPRLAALDRLQKQLALTPDGADAWVREARQLRHDSDRLARIWRDAGQARRVAEPAPRRRK